MAGTHDAQLALDALPPHAAPPLAIRRRIRRPMKTHDHPTRVLRLFSLSSVSSPAEAAAVSEVATAKLALIFKDSKKRKAAAPKAAAPKAAAAKAVAPKAADKPK